MSKFSQVIVCAIIAVISVTAGYLTSPEEIRIPVLLANGKVMERPCYMTVNGREAVLVDSEKTAESVIDQIKEEYSNEATVDVKIVEKTSVKNMQLENGDEEPEVLTESEAAKHLVEEEIVTVETREVVVEGSTIKHDTVENETEELPPGETKVIREGEDGFVLKTKELKKENGMLTSEVVVSEKVLTEAVDEIVISGSYDLSEPLDYMRVTSEFGPRWGRNHDGVDLGMAEGSAIYAAKSGVVTVSGYSGSYGNLVKIDHGGGVETYYAHCSSLAVTEGESVSKGQIIGYVGSTGNSTGPHLHFEVRIDGQPQNPLDWIKPDGIQ